MSDPDGRVDDLRVAAVATPQSMPDQVEVFFGERCGNAGSEAGAPCSGGLILTLAIRTTMMISRNYLTMKTPGIFFTMSVWIRVSFTHRTYHISQFRRSGRPAHRFRDTRLG